MADSLQKKREAAIAYLRERKKWVLEFAFNPSRGADVAATRRQYLNETSKVRHVKAVK